MSDDITQRLRVAMPTFKGLETSCPCAVRSALMMEAAAEIERLRSEEVLASHQGSAQREWHSVGAWLYPGDSINVVRAPLPEIRVEP